MTVGDVLSADGRSSRFVAVTRRRQLGRRCRHRFNAAALRNAKGRVRLRRRAAELIRRFTLAAGWYNKVRCSSSSQWQENTCLQCWRLVTLLVSIGPTNAGGGRFARWQWSFAIRGNWDPQPRLRHPKGAKSLDETFFLARMQIRRISSLHIYIQRAVIG